MGASSPDTTGFRELFEFRQVGRGRADRSDIWFPILVPLLTCLATLDKGLHFSEPVSPYKMGYICLMGFKQKYLFNFVQVLSDLG